MKKLILIIFAVIILSGCEAEYTIDIDNMYLETITCKPNSTEELESMKSNIYKYPAIYDEDYFEEENKELPNIERYHVSIEDTVTYKYKFCNDYDNSNIAHISTMDFGLFLPSAMSDTSGIYADDFSKVFDRYPGLTKLTINIKSSKEVFEDSHNADYVNGNVYTWVITRDNPKREIYYHFLSEYSEEDEFPNCKDDIDDNDGGQVTPVDPSNNNNNNENDTKKETKTKNNSWLLYVLIPLFFVSLFAIIIPRGKRK